VTTAVPVELKKHWRDVDALWAARVGVFMVAAAVLVVCAVMARWRYGHAGWLPATVVGGVAAAVLVAAAILAIGSGQVRRVVGDGLLLVGAAAAAIAAALAVPGPLGAPHAGLAAAVAVAAAGLIVRFTGRHVGLCTAVIALGVAALVCGLARMVWMTSAVTLLTSVLLVTLVGIKVAPTIARWAAGIRLPVFPSASGRWIFETRPDLPSAVVVAGGESPVLEGPESVRDVVVASDRAHAYLSGLLAGFGALLVICCVGLCDPGAERRWLALLLSGVVAGAVLLHGRSYSDRWQATVLALTAVAIVVGVSLRYAVGLWTLPALLVACAVILLVPAAGLVAAVVVPNHVYTPVFRYAVEWVEYASLFAVYPLGFWLMNVFAAIRYR
jgi:type VII secretion integral membrane protein EccD